jgi:hypothetical protein
MGSGLWIGLEWGLSGRSKSEGVGEGVGEGSGKNDAVFGAMEVWLCEDCMLCSSNCMA